MCLHHAKSEYICAQMFVREHDDGLWPASFALLSHTCLYIMTTSSPQIISAHCGQAYDGHTHTHMHSPASGECCVLVWRKVRARATLVCNEVRTCVHQSVVRAFFTNSKICKKLKDCVKWNHGCAWLVSGIRHGFRVQGLNHDRFHGIWWSTYWRISAHENRSVGATPRVHGEYAKLM